MLFSPFTITSLSFCRFRQDCNISKIEQIAFRGYTYIGDEKGLITHIGNTQDVFAGCHIGNSKYAPFSSATAPLVSAESFTISNATVAKLTPTFPGDSTILPTNFPPSTYPFFVTFAVIGMVGDKANEKVESKRSAARVRKEVIFTGIGFRFLLGVKCFNKLCGYQNITKPCHLIFGLISLPGIFSTPFSFK
jgi:hypothetical protein